MNEDKIRPAHSRGDECFWCEKEIARGSGCVKIEFKVKIPLLGSTSKEEFAHANCADQIASLLYGASQEARSMTRKL
jgi:hypothetical protein